jgi:hypothetical protein
MTAVAPTVEATRAAADAGERLHPFRQFVSDKLAAAGLVRAPAATTCSAPTNWGATSSPGS